MKNVVLIGMPGCGKTTVGMAVALALGRPHLETDDLVVQGAGRTISALFAEEGEPYFRNLEAAAVRQAAETENVVISTGGGVVLRPENMEALGKTGLVFFLDRSPEDIIKSPLENRPLIGGDLDRVFALYHQRIALYRAYGQYPVRCCAGAEDAAAQVVEIFNREGFCL